MEYQEDKNNNAKLRITDFGKFLIYIYSKNWNISMTIFRYFIYLFIHLFIYLIIYLFIYLFFVFVVVVFVFWFLAWIVLS